MTPAAARRLALALPEASEQDHHGFPSFRVGGKIFATLPDAAHLHVMVAPDEAEMAVSAAPKAVEKLWWGKTLAGVRIRVAAAERALVAGLLEEAWKRRAPRRLLAGARPV